jgi:hypothetical protein
MSPLPPQPAPPTFADRLYAELEPFARLDESGHLRIFCDAVATMFEPLATWVQDTDLYPGWSLLLDPDRTPPEALGYTAQYGGVRLQPGLSEDLQRQRIKSTDGMHRGTPAAVISAAQQSLTGQKRVILRERWDSISGLPDPYYAEIITVTSETPDPAQVIRDVTPQKPAGLIFTYAVREVQDWEEMQTTHATWTAVEGAYPTWRSAEEDHI